MHDARGRIRVAKREGAAVLRRQRLGQHEEAVERVQEAQTGRDEERQPQPDSAEQTAEDRSEDEAYAEGDVDQAVVPGPGFRRRDVGDVGVRRRDAGAHDPGDDPAHEQPGDRRRKAHDQIVQTEPEHGEQENASTAEAIGQGAEDGGAQELRHRVAGGDGAHGDRGGRRVAAPELLDEFGEDGNDEADAQHVEAG